MSALEHFRKLGPFPSSVLACADAPERSAAATVHYATARMVSGVVVLTLACGEDHASQWWSVNKEGVTCWKCRQRM